MRERFSRLWQNLILLYLGIFLIMSAWGAADALLTKAALPAAEFREQREGRIPSIGDLLGIWPVRGKAGRRVLQLAIPGLAAFPPARLM